VIVQENRAPDNLFHDPVLIAGGADIASSGINSSGQTIQLTPSSLAFDYDLSHKHSAFLEIYDNGKMDGADQVAAYCSAGAADCAPLNPQFRYVQASMSVRTSKWPNNTYLPIACFKLIKVFPAHQFLISGTSAPTPTSALFADGNPEMDGKATTAASCIAPAGARVDLIGPSCNAFCSTYPCFEHPTLFDELNNKGISWRYYTPSTGSIWTGPNAINHICVPQTKDGVLS
jgi:hypothetical protein